MRIALISAGPSVAQTYDPEADFDLRVAVNSAAGLYAADWWVAGDRVTFERVRPLGDPAVFTMANGVEAATARRVVRWEPLKKRVDAPTCWTNWSITAALTFAVDLGASAVEVFGHDLSGTADAGGHVLKQRVENWKRIRRDWPAVRAWAEGRGVAVHEHQPEAAACT